MPGLRSCLAVPLLLSSMAHAMPMPGAGGGRALYLPMILREAAAAGVPPSLADAVAMVETGYRPDALGSSGEIGLMQVMPGTARQLGFAGTLADLADPATNIRIGVRYLARAWTLGGGDICRALMKYRAGLGQEVMTALSARYCTRAIAWLGSTGSTLARDAILPDGAPAPRPAIDPYAIAVVPALAAQARLRPILATAHETLAAYRPQRSMADRSRALNDRFLSHQRHYGPFPKPAGSTSDVED